VLNVYSPKKNQENEMVRTFLLPNERAALEQLSKDRHIPIEWLEHNVRRNDKNDGWEVGYKGKEPQIRYDNPQPDPDKPEKLVRYKSKFGCKADAYTPYMPDGKSYAQYIGAKIQSGEISINDVCPIITEGHFKSITGCVHDIFTISVTGIWKWFRKDDDGNKILCTELQSYINDGVKKFIIGFDADCVHNPDVHRASVALGRHLESLGCTVYLITGLWDVSQGKGMDDFINQNGVDAFREVLEKAYTLEAYIEKFDTPKSKRRSPENKKKTHAQIVKELSDFYGDRIRLNEMTNEVEKDGREYYLDSSFIHISQEAKIELAKTYAIDYLVEVARNNAYHPVVEYLNSVKGKAQNLDTDTALSKLHTMLSEITGVTDKLHLTFIAKTLVAAVNRVFKPGCFFKRVCVFYGQQDAGKSSFWRELAGDKFFNSSYKGTTDKHDLMSLHSAWVNEIAEFDKVYRKTDVANLKAVISDPFDKVVLPYGRSTVTLHRRSILVASTNRQDILLDPTGNSRFWVVVIPGKIDFKSLIEYRDLIWACAYNLFNSGYSYELSEDEQVASAANNERFTSFDPLFDAVEDACRVVGWIKDSEEYITISEVYNYLYPESSGKVLKPGDWKPIADVLTRLGYTSGHKPRKDGKQVSAWKLEKKVENFTVTAVTNSENQTQQGVPSCYHDVTVNQPTVTEKYQKDTKMLPSEVHGNSTVTPTVTPTVQGVQPPVTDVTVKSQNFSNSTPEKWRVNVNAFASYGGELVQVVGGDGKKWQVEHRKPDGSFGGFTKKVPTAHLKHPDLATINHWDNVSPLEDDKPAF
jgi:predicted P-loop ATPase